MTEKKRGDFPYAFSVSELNLPERRFKSGKSGGFCRKGVQSLCLTKVEKFHKTEIAFFR